MRMARKHEKKLATSATIKCLRCGEYILLTTCSLSFVAYTIAIGLTEVEQTILVTNFTIAMAIVFFIMFVLMGIANIALLFQIKVRT